jgi:hypothetical protein
MKPPLPERFPTPERISGPRSWRWWHRIRGHTTRGRLDMLVFNAGWECLDCELVIGWWG